MERMKWEEREKAMEETVVQDQEEAQTKNLDKGKTNYRCSRWLIGF